LPHHPVRIYISTPITELTNNLTANSGIGFGLAALLIEDASKHVILGSRSVSKGEAALKDLQSKNLPGSVELQQLDVTDEESIGTAAANVERTHGRSASTHRAPFGSRFH
jgi:NAD(P)-dependent dehydrogenase (short-subunit alcohol dehydrogenase family)